MSVYTVNPENMDILRWTDVTGLNLSGYGVSPRLDDPRDWQAWGASLLNNPSIRGIALPDPYQFSDWRRWADRVNEALSSVSP